MDSLTRRARSENMRRIRSGDTGPEMVVRRLVHGMGFRYRLHVRALPGKPDLVFARLRRVIQVRGCFWHQHGRCVDSHIPKSRRAYWVPKLEGNVARDRLNDRLLRGAGWRVLVVWSCQTEGRKAGSLAGRLSRFLA